MHYFKVISPKLCEEALKQPNPRKSFKLLCWTHSLSYSWAIVCNSNNGPKINASKTFSVPIIRLNDGVKQVFEMLTFRSLLMWLTGQEQFIQETSVKDFGLLTYDAAWLVKWFLTFLQNVWNHLLSNAASHPKWLEPLIITLLWKPQKLAKCQSFKHTHMQALRQHAWQLC